MVDLNNEAERAAPDMLAAFHEWMKRRGPLGAGAMPERIFFAGWLASRRASAVVGDDGLPPIDYDRDMDRTYIPLPGGWEIQTKGKGSTFRIAHVQQKTRWQVLDEELHEPLEAMARDMRDAIAADRGAARRAASQKGVAEAPALADLINRFLAWPLPDSLSARLAPNIEMPIGTHLMNADEAKAMIEYVLAANHQGKEGANADQA